MKPLPGNGDFVGHGVVHVFNTRAEDFQLSLSLRNRVSCVPAHGVLRRWVIPERKLEIVLLKPGTNHIGTWSYYYLATNTGLLHRRGPVP